MLQLADIGIQLQPKTSSSNIDDDPPYLALDITFAHTPYIATTLSSDHPVSTNPTCKVHDDSAKQNSMSHMHTLCLHTTIFSYQLLPIILDAFLVLSQHPSFSVTAL
jgi:hypothetical protein